jgi:hypothetical protein
VTADQTSPGHAAARYEQLLRFADAMRELLLDQREVVVLKNLQGPDLLHIAGTTGKTVGSIAGLFRNRLNFFFKLQHDCSRNVIATVFKVFAGGLKAVERFCGVAEF